MYFLALPRILPRRRISTPPTKRLSVLIKDPRQRCHDDRQCGEHRGGPLMAESLVHLHTKEGKGGCNETQMSVKDQRN